MCAEPFVPLTLARILRPWGRRGEVAAEVLTDFPQKLAQIKEAWLAEGRSPARRISVRSCRIHLGQAIFHFEGIQTISEAETLRGLEVRVPLEERARLGSDRYYITDLVGCQIWEDGANAHLGVVQDVQRAGDEQSTIPEAWVLVINTPAGELLIPLAAEICTRVDIQARRIEVRLPEGLRELNTR